MPDDKLDPRPNRDLTWLKRLGWLLLLMCLVFAGRRLILTTWSGGTSCPSVAAAPPAPGEATVTIALANVPKGACSWLLVHTTTTSSSCPRNVVATFTDGTIDIAKPPSDCGTERAVFADGFAPNLTLDPDWGATVPIQLDAMLTVGIRAVGLYAGAAGEFDAALKQANALYGTNRMGMTFTATASFQTLIDPDTQALRDAILAAQKRDPGCGADVVSQPSLFDSGSKDLYVFFIEAGSWNLGGDYGYTCPSQPNVIFLREGAKSTLLAHEIGHAMGLTHTEGDLSPVWTGDTAHKGNVMYSAAFAPGTTPEVTHFTLGQAYRANFGLASWLNRSDLRTGPTADCGESLDEAGPCPYIQLGW